MATCYCVTNTVAPFRNLYPSSVGACRLEVQKDIYRPGRRKEARKEPGDHDMMSFRQRPTDNFGSQAGTRDIRSFVRSLRRSYASWTCAARRAILA
jgi:hypothetical protein